MTQAQTGDRDAMKTQTPQRDRQKSAECHEQASKHHESGGHITAEQYSHITHRHTDHTTAHGAEPSNMHANKHGNKTLSRP